jgi:hypothetical protein
MHGAFGGCPAGEGMLRAGVQDMPRDYANNLAATEIHAEYSSSPVCVWAKRNRFSPPQPGHCEWSTVCRCGRSAQPAPACRLQKRHYLDCTLIGSSLSHPTINFRFSNCLQSSCMHRKDHTRHQGISIRSLSQSNYSAPALV